MSMFTNLFHKNSASNSNLLAQQSSLVSNPLISNATQMNNEFLTHHNKQFFNQQGSMLQQPIISQAPIAPVYQAPLASSFLSNTFQSSTLQRGSTYHRGGPYRQIRLRTHSWGNRSENGWSGFNNWKYLPQNLASWEPKNVVLEELRMQSRQNRGLNFQQSFVQAPLAAAPIVAQPAPILFAGKQSRGHHHGLRKKRAQAVLPVQPIGGGPAIATIAPTPIVAAPIVAAPVLAAPIATRAAPLVAPLHETIVKPTIIQETVRTDRVVEVQPVLHREIEQPVVNHIEKHITEAPALSRGGVVRLAPIVEQNTQTRVINEVTPIIHRERAVAQVERVEEHLVEHVVAPTQHTNSVVNESVIAQPALLNTSAPLVAPLTASPALASAPLTNTIPMTKVVPTAPVNAYGSAMM